MKNSFYIRLLFVFLLSIFHNQGMAQQSQSPYDPTKSLECMITTDFYIVHLTSYLVPKPDSEKRHAFKPFCQELPEHGSSYLAIDFIDRDLRQMPVGMEVYELVDNPDGEDMINGQLIATSPTQTYKTGVAQIQADFPKPGHYVLVASVGDDMFADKIRIPLRVGIGSAFHISSLYPYIFFILAVGCSYGIYRFSIYRHKRKQETSVDTAHAEDETTEQTSDD